MTYLPGMAAIGRRLRRRGDSELRQPGEVVVAVELQRPGLSRRRVSFWPEGGAERRQPLEIAASRALTSGGSPGAGAAEAL